jgi:Ser/Thr protein kinase RdoA (MazF antagonist)
MLDGFRYVKDFPYTEEQQIRDLVALRLKALAVKLHNDYHQFKEAQGLIWCAYNIAGTQKVKDLCHKDLVVINQTVENHTGLAGFLNSGIGGCLLRIIYNIIVFGIFVLICSIIGGW